MPDPWYRVKRIRQTFRHVGTISATVAKAFDEHIPFRERGASAQDVMASALERKFRYRVGSSQGSPPVPRRAHRGPAQDAVEVGTLTDAPRGSGPPAAARPGRRRGCANTSRYDMTTYIGKG